MFLTETLFYIFVRGACDRAFAICLGGGREEERKRVGETKGPLLSVVRRKTEMPFFFTRRHVFYETACFLLNGLFFTKRLFFNETSMFPQTYFIAFSRFAAPRCESTTKHIGIH